MTKQFYTLPIIIVCAFFLLAKNIPAEDTSLEAILGKKYAKIEKLIEKGKYSKAIKKLKKAVGDNDEKKTALKPMMMQLIRKAKVVKWGVKASDANLKIFLDVGGRTQKVKVLSVTEKEITIDFNGQSMPVSWGSIEPYRMYFLGKAFAPSRSGKAMILLAKMALADNLTEQVEDALNEAVSRDTSLGGDAKKIRAGMNAELQAANAEKTAEMNERAEIRQAEAKKRAAETAKKRGLAAGSPDTWKTGNGLFLKHPRLMLRPNGGKGIFSLAEFKKRVGGGRAMGILKPGGRADLAAKWLSKGDKASADKAIQMMKKLPSGHDPHGPGAHLFDAALAYDWLYNYEGFRAKDKAEVRGAMMKVARMCNEYLYDSGKHMTNNIWNNGLFAGVAMMAIYDEEEDAPELFRSIHEMYLKELEAVGIMDGGWPEGYTYANTGVLQTMMAYALCYQSFTGHDIFAMAKGDKYNDALRGIGRWFMHATNPAHKGVAWVDYSAGTPATTGELKLPHILSMAYKYKDPQLQEFAKEIMQKYSPNMITVVKGNRTLGFFESLFASVLNAKYPADPRPTSKMFSPTVLRQAFMRSSWKQDATWVAIHFPDLTNPTHCHPDVGQFEIFRKKPLVVDSGAYNLGSPHYKKYFHATISNNCIMTENSKGELEGQIFRRRTVIASPEALGDTENSNWNRAKLLDWKQTPKVDYIAADMSKAYSSGKYIRRLAFVKPHTVVILDTVKGASGTPVWLLHTEDEPKISGGKVSYPKGNGLAVQMLLPNKANIKPVGGKGNEYLVGGSNPKPPAPGPNATLGKWRLEVRPPQKTKSTTFLSVISTNGAATTSIKDDGATWTLNVNGTKLKFVKTTGECVF